MKAKYWEVCYGFSEVAETCPIVYLKNKNFRAYTELDYRNLDEKAEACAEGMSRGNFKVVATKLWMQYKEADLLGAQYEFKAKHKMGGGSSLWTQWFTGINQEDIGERAMNEYLRLSDTKLYKQISLKMTMKATETYGPKNAPTEKEKEEYNLLLEELKPHPEETLLPEPLIESDGDGICCVPGDGIMEDVFGEEDFIEPNEPIGIEGKIGEIILNYKNVRRALPPMVS